jgi:hypothetical protein
MLIGREKLFFSIYYIFDCNVYTLYCEHNNFETSKGLEFDLSVEEYKKKIADYLIENYSNNEYSKSFKINAEKNKKRLETLKNKNNEQNKEDSITEINENSFSETIDEDSNELDQNLIDKILNNEPAMDKLINNPTFINKIDAKISESFNIIFIN